MRVRCLYKTSETFFVCLPPPRLPRVAGKTNKTNEAVVKCRSLKCEILAYDLFSLYRCLHCFVSQCVRVIGSCSAECKFTTYLDDEKIQIIELKMRSKQSRRSNAKMLMKVISIIGRVSRAYLRCIVRVFECLLSPGFSLWPYQVYTRSLAKFLGIFDFARWWIRLCCGRNSRMLRCKKLALNYPNESGRFYCVLWRYFTCVVTLFKLF